MFPSNEAEVIDLYRLVQWRLGWRIVHLQNAFPDAIIESEDGERLVVEFEYLSKNFGQHGHDPDGCDLVICWRDNWPDAPLPIQSLEDYTHSEVKQINNMFRLSFWEKKRRKEGEEENNILKRENKSFKQEIQRLKTVIVSMKQLAFQIVGEHNLADIATFYTNTVEDYEQMEKLMDLIFTIPEGRAIINWMRTAEIPSRERTNQILGGISND